MRDADPRRVLVDTVDAALVITLDRPERRNALDAAMVSQLMAAVGRAAASPSVRVVVLTASPPVFCAGSDVAELAVLPSGARAATQEFWPALEACVRGCAVPVVAAIAGGAWGGGLFLATFADLRIATEDARFATPEVSLGWLPPGGIEALIDLVGVGAATDLILTGRTIGAAEALRFGLVNRIVAADALRDAAIELAQAISALPSTGVASSRRYLRERSALDRTSRDRLALQLFATDVVTHDADRSLARFIKR